MNRPVKSHCPLCDEPAVIATVSTKKRYWVDLETGELVSPEKAKIEEIPEMMYDLKILSEEPQEVTYFCLMCENEVTDEFEIFDSANKLKD